MALTKEQEELLAMRKAQVPTMTPELLAERREQRGPMENAPGLMGQILGTPGQMLRNADGVMADFQRAATPAGELGATTAPMSDVLGISIPERSPLSNAPTQAPQAPATPTTDATLPPMIPTSPISGSAVGTNVDVAGNPFQGMNPLQNGVQMAQAPTQAPMGNAPMGEDATKARIQEIFGTAQPATLNQAITGNPEAVMRNDAQGRMRSFETPLAASEDLTQGQASFDQASAAREQRIEQNFGQVRGPDSTDRAEDEMTMADAKDLVALNNPRASVSDQARAKLVAERNGLDPMTGQKPAAPEGMSVRDQVAISAEERALRGEAEEVKAIKAEEAQSLSRATSAAKGLVQQADNIGDIAKTAQRQAGKAFTTGVGGLIMSLKPGSTAKDMRANLDTLTADAAFTSLQAMRDASKTGGALGQVSERELTLLGAAVRSLDANQSDEQLVGNIKEYVRLRNQSMARIREAFATDYGAEAANEVFGSKEGKSKRYANDQDSGASIEDLTLPKSK
jgi:hypothetical protein